MDDASPYDLPAKGTRQPVRGADGGFRQTSCKGTLNEAYGLHLPPSIIQATPALHIYAPHILQSRRRRCGV